MVVRTCNSSTWEGEAGRVLDSRRVLHFPTYAMLGTEFRASNCTTSPAPGTYICWVVSPSHDTNGTGQLVLSHQSLPSNDHRSNGFVLKYLHLFIIKRDTCAMAIRQSRGQPMRAGSLLPPRGPWGWLVNRFSSKHLHLLSHLPARDGCLNQMVSQGIGRKQE